MPDETDLHVDNDTPCASDSDIKRMDKDTPHQGEGTTGGSKDKGVRIDRDPSEKISA
jgi:hypothetical protein